MFVLQENSSLIIIFTKESGHVNVNQINTKSRVFSTGQHQIIGDSLYFLSYNTVFGFFKSDLEMIYFNGIEIKVNVEQLLLRLSSVSFVQNESCLLNNSINSCKSILMENVREILQVGKQKKRFLMEELAVVF